MAHILIAEDEPGMLEGLKDNFEFEGYQVSTAQNGMEAKSLLEQKAFDLILSDVMMPKLSGTDLLKWLREHDQQTPFILLTAKGQEMDRVLGLEYGADDYITKPFSLRELLARVKSILRRANRVPHKKRFDRIVLGDVVIDFHLLKVHKSGNPINFTTREIRLLHYLVEKSPHSATRDELLKDVWGYESSPTTRTVDNFILRIRQRIEPDPANPSFILTVHGEGYQLVLPRPLD